MFPIHSHLPTGHSKGWREPTPMPTLPLSCKRPALFHDRASPHPPLLFFLPTQRASGRSKRVQRFLSCAKPKLNFHTSSSSSGAAQVLGGEDWAGESTHVPSPAGPGAPEGARREPTGRFGSREGV